MVPLSYAPNDAANPHDMAGISDADDISFPLSQALKNILSIAEGPASAQGTLAVELVPGFDYSEVSSIIPLVYTADTVSGQLLYIYMDGTAYIGRTYDGAHAVGVAKNFSANTAYDLTVRWSSAAGQMQVGVDEAWGAAVAFDGAYVLGDHLRLGYAPALPMRLGRVKIWDAWLDEAPRAVMEPWDWPDYSQAISVASPHLVHFLDQTYRHWRLELADPNNAEGYIRAGGLYLGDYFQPSRGFALGYTASTVASRQTAAGAAGKLAGCSLGLNRSLLISFSRLSQEDAQGFEAMMAAVHGKEGGPLTPMFFTPFSDQAGDTLYCLPQAELNVQQTAGGRWDLSLNLQEAVKTNV